MDFAMGNWQHAAAVSWGHGKGRMDWVTGGCEHFEIREPTSQTIPFVFNSPHSGRCYTHAFLSGSRLDSLAIRRSADHYVDELFAAAPELGAPFLDRKGVVQGKSGS